MKEDILEQLVEDWLIAQKGWFVKHNVKYRPCKRHPEYIPNKDSVHSDIDILAFSNLLKGKDRVRVVTCKSWQNGFDIRKWKTHLELEPEYNERSSAFKPREKWKYFRELTSDKWTESFINMVKDETSQKDLTYYIAVTKYIGSEEDKESFEQSQILKSRFKKFGSDFQIKIISIEKILSDLFDRLKKKDTPVLEATEVGRLLQLIDAAGLNINQQSGLIAPKRGSKQNRILTDSTQ